MIVPKSKVFLGNSLLQCFRWGAPDVDVVLQFFIKFASTFPQITTWHSSAAIDNMQGFADIRSDPIDFIPNSYVFNLHPLIFENISIPNPECIIKSTLVQTTPLNRTFGIISGARRKKFRRVQVRGSGLVGGPGGGAPRTPENFRKLKKKNSRRKLKKRCIFAYYAKNSKPCVKFSRVWTKNTIVWGKLEKILKISDENSMEKLNFYLFLGNFVAKNRTFGNNIIFLQQFFPVRGGWTPPPCVRHWKWQIEIYHTTLKLLCKSSR